MANLSKLPKVLQNVMAERKIAKASSGAGEFSSLLKGGADDMRMPPMDPMGPMGPMGGPPPTGPIPGMMPEVMPQGPSGLIEGLKPEGFAPGSNPNQLPASIIEFMKTFDQPGAVIPERNLFGMKRMDMSPTGDPMPLGVLDRKGYDITTPNRTSGLRSILDAGEVEGFPLSMTPPSVSGSSRVATIVGEGEGNFGPKKNIFGGIEKHSEILNKDAFKLAKNWFTSKAKTAEKIGIKEKTKPETFIAYLDEAARVFEGQISGHGTEIDKLVKALGTMRASKDYRESFLREWMSFRLNKGEFLKKHKNNKDLVRYFSSIEKVSKIAEVLEENVNMAKELAKVKAPVFTNRPPVGRVMEDVTGPTRGMPAPRSTENIMADIRNARGIPGSTYLPDSVEVPASFDVKQKMLDRRRINAIPSGQPNSPITFPNRPVSPLNRPTDNPLPPILTMEGLLDRNRVSAKKDISRRLKTKSRHSAKNTLLADILRGGG